MFFFATAGRVRFCILELLRLARKRERLGGDGRAKSTQRERENSECFIVEGHLTRYKWYDYKHAHTTYTKHRRRKKGKKREKKSTQTQKLNNNNNKKAENYPRCRQHTSVTCKSKHSHIWLNTHYGGGGGGVPTPPSLLLSRHQNMGREPTTEIRHILEITFKV